MGPSFEWDNVNVIVVSEGYWGGGTAGGWGAVGAPGGSDTEVRVARSWLVGDGPVTGPLTATAAGFGGTTFGGKLIADFEQKQTIHYYIMLHSI